MTAHNPGLSGTAASSPAAPVRTVAPRARSGIVIGSTRRKRGVLVWA